jgi:hypothetical protein
MTALYTAILSKFESPSNETKGVGIGIADGLAIDASGSWAIFGGYIGPGNEIPGSRTAKILDRLVFAADISSSLIFAETPNFTAVLTSGMDVTGMETDVWLSAV